MITIYHNTRCRKSRETLNLIKESGKEVSIVEYLKNPPDPEEIREIVTKLNMPVEKLIRKNEALYKEQYKGKDLSEEDWYKVLAENPILIERPIVIKGSKAVMGRPPENVKVLLG